MNDCNCNRCHQNPCCCGVAMPVIDVQALPGDPLTLTWNFNGVGTSYDYSYMIKQGETETSINADQVARVLKYMSEKGTYTISAKELGAILHLTDIGDVDVTDVDNNSFLVYKKESDCSRGCDDSINQWKAFNALDNPTTSLEYIMGFDNEGAPFSLFPPDNTAQQYFLAWNGNGKVGWTQLKTAASMPTNAYQVIWDEDSKSFVKVRVQ